METTPQLAEQLVTGCLRPGEELLHFTEGIKLGMQGFPSSLGGGNQKTWVAVTPARLIEVHLRNQTPSSGAWADMTWLRAFKERRRWYYQWQHKTQSMEYSPVEVTREFAETLQAIQSGVISTMLLPVESCAPLRYHRPHDDSTSGQFAQAMNFSEFRYQCGSCGVDLFYFADEDRFLPCTGCLRVPDPTQARDR